MNGHDALDAATAGFAAVLAQVAADCWTTPSINPGWSVRDLVNHVVGGNRRYVLLLTEAPTAEVEALRDLDHLSDDPMRDFATTSGELAAAFRAPGALGVTVHHRLGDRTGADLLTMRISEHALHGWDLARSIGVDDTIDAGVVQLLVDEFTADPELPRRNSFDHSDRTVMGTPQERLLGLTGRTATG